MANRRVKIMEIAVECGVLYGTIYNINIDHLHMSKV